jgi:murein DD-endopeptidase MepM/ murein hydrolase activator NlpD
MNRTSRITTAPSRRALAATLGGVALLAALWQFGARAGSGNDGSDAALASAPSSATVRSGPTARAIPETPATVGWLPERVVEGTLFTVVVEGGDPAVHAVAGEFAGEPLHFREEARGVQVALAAAPLDSLGERTLTLRVTYAGGAVEPRRSRVPVEAGDYRMERLSVAPQYGQPQPPELQRRIASEAARARAVSAASHGTPRMWEPPLVAPRESRITSGFGHGRMFNDQVQSRHTGTDFAGAVGAPVRAPADGVVALVDAFYLGGGVIYIDHGAGLVTGYLHLSTQDVNEGDTVAAGQVIGRVGATGRVTGPHLHWIVRYGGHTVDGMTLLERGSDDSFRVPVQRDTLRASH